MYLILVKDVCRCFGTFLVACCQFSVVLLFSTEYRKNDFGCSCFWFLLTFLHNLRAIFGRFCVVFERFLDFLDKFPSIFGRFLRGFFVNFPSIFVRCPRLILDDFWAFLPFSDSFWTISRLFLPFFFVYF